MIEVILVLCVIVLFVMYGNLSYKQGYRHAKSRSELLGIYKALLYLDQKNIIGVDENSLAIYRIKDDGGRGETLNLLPPEIQSNSSSSSYPNL